MKLRLILILSVCVNLALAGAYFIGKRPSAAPGPASPTADSTKSTVKSNRERRAQIVVNGVTNDFRWGSVESDDYRRYIANLREIGCPEETIRDIIIADVNKLYAGRLAALYPSPQDFKWWQTTDDRANRDERRDRERKRRDLNEEKRALIKELLGVDLETEMARWEGRPDEDAFRTGFLSAEKQQAVQALQDKFREMERSLFNEMRENRNNPENRAKMLAMRAQREAELAQILGPQDYQEYQLRNSGTAREMRDSLGSFSPSEEEFKKIFELRKSFDDQFAFGRGGGDEAAREQRRAAEQQIDQQLQTTLGAERYAEYKLAQDDNYRRVYDFTTDQKLSKETALSLYEMQKEVGQKREQLMRDQSISPDERTAKLAEIAAVTKQTLEQTLPQQTYELYLRSDAGRWVPALTSPQQGGRQGFGGPRGGFGGFQGGPGGGGGPDRRYSRGGGGGR